MFCGFFPDFGAQLSTARSGCLAIALRASRRQNIRTTTWKSRRPAVSALSCRSLISCLLGVMNHALGK